MIPAARLKTFEQVPRWRDGGFGKPHPAVLWSGVLLRQGVDEGIQLATHPRKTCSERPPVGKSLLFFDC
jgi:hypothetical protein